jgi:hypothetical protein
MSKSTKQPTPPSPKPTTEAKKVLADKVKDTASGKIVTK